MWHASVAALNGPHDGPTPYATLSPSTQRLLVKVAKILIADVGQLPSAVEHMGGVAVHYRRGLTDEEYALLTPVWRAIPAVHEAGRGTILETNT